jgi:hypothetical protein
MLIHKKVPTQNDRLQINETISEVIALTRSEVLRNGVSLQTRRTCRSFKEIESNCNK